MSVWNTATPAGSDPISQGDDRIREMKAAIQDALQADGGVFPGAAPATAPVYYPVILKDVTANRPAVSASYPGRMFFDYVRGAIQRLNNAGDTWEDMTFNPATQAIHQKGETALASTTGVLTLDETSNEFAASGAEALTSIAGWSLGRVYIRWTTARTLTHNGATLVLIGGISRSVAAGDFSIFEFFGASAVREVATSSRTNPTRQVFLSGSAATYTTPVGVRQLRISMVGGGGGGGSGAAVSVVGTAGGATTFNSISVGGGAKGGDYAGAVTAGGAGGTGGSGTASVRAPGNGGGGGSATGSGGVGAGGGSAFFGGGANAVVGNADTNGVSAVANSGGGGSAGLSSGSGGGGGGGGESAEILINAPAATYTYTVGAGGTGSTGVAPNVAGGAGGSGIIIVDELY